MSIQGELTINLSSQGKCTISSSRPVQMGRLFSGKSIDQTLKTLPMLFSICGKAQTITTARAIECAMNTPVSRDIESKREALISLESLREQSLRLLMDWPSYINVEPEQHALSHVATGVNHLMQRLQPDYLLSYLPHLSNPASPSHQDSQHWKGFSKKLAQLLFASSTDSWLDSLHHSVEDWASQQQTQSARFIHCINQQPWKHTGSSQITALPDWGEGDDKELVSRLQTENEAFTRQPDWKGNCHEVSWFQRQQTHAVVSPLVNANGNGIHTRMIARLVDVAELMQKLERFFIQGALLQPITTKVAGLAHTDSARGCLTHYVELENQTINKLVILAPTEWNFHPRGVAQQSLERLTASDTDMTAKMDLLKQQAELMIHAIDPCVGYTLNIDTHTNNNNNNTSSDSTDDTTSKETFH